MKKRVDFVQKRIAAMMVAMLLCMTFGIGSAHSQAPGTSPMQYPIAQQRAWQEEFREFVLENYRGLIVPAQTSAQRKRLALVQFDFPVGAHDMAFNFRSQADDRVILPVPSLLFYRDLALAEAWLSVNRKSLAPVTDYLSILAHGRLDTWPLGRRLPLNALGIPSDAAKDQRVMSRYVEGFRDVVLFVVGHEMGHILQGFEATSSSDFARRRQAELNADRVAFDWFQRMPRIPLGAVLWFATASRLLPIAELYGDNIRLNEALNSRTHPLDGVRIGAVRQHVSAGRTDYINSLRDQASATTVLSILRDELKKLEDTVDDMSALVTQADCAASYAPRDLLPRPIDQDVPEVAPRAGERFPDVPFSGVFVGSFRSNKSGQSTALRLLLRRDGNQLTGETQYLCFRGRVEGEVSAESAVVRWYVADIKRTVVLRAGARADIAGTWRSDNVAAGGDGSLSAARTSP